MRRIVRAKQSLATYWGGTLTVMLASSLVVTELGTTSSLVPLLAGELAVT